MSSGVDASNEDEEEDLGALIDRESQIRKKESVAAELAKKRRRNSSSSTRRSTSTRQATAGRKDKNSDEMIANSRHQREADIHLEMMRSGKFIHKLLGRNTDMNDLLMGAQTVLILEECARGTVQRSNYAAVKDALSGGADGHFTVVKCCPAEKE
jgi:hypothetical protein